MATETASPLIESLEAIYQLETLEGWQLLKRHFELSEGFSFIVVVAPDDWGIALIRSHLTTILPPGTNWQRVVFDPAAPFQDLSEQLINLSVSQATSLVWIDAEPGDLGEQSWWEDRSWAWKQSLAYLNRYRNTLQARFRCTAVFS